MKILYIAGEVAPFSDTTDAAKLARRLPEVISETEDHEVRVMMPRYGVVSERRNRLHEVIRLSGADINAGDERDTLKVKVASIPGIRLQVYFMDSVKFFKKKGLHKDRKSGVLFDDNAARALFFARAVFDTTQKLGWSPDVIHASGWVAAFVPVLLRGELADDPLFSSTGCVYTPDETDESITLSAEEAVALELSSDLVGQTLQEIGMNAADAVAYAGEPIDGGPEGVDLLAVMQQEDVTAEEALDYYRPFVVSHELAA